MMTQSKNASVPPAFPHWASRLYARVAAKPGQAAERRTHADELLLSQLEQLRAENRRLAHLASVDPVTCVPNRRALEARLSEMFAPGQNGPAVALCLVDFDDLKAYNDYYGHLKGDRALTYLARTLAAHLPQHDGEVFRSGGDEFCMLFRAPTPAHAQRTVATARGALHTLRIPHIRSQHGIVTASFGCCWLAAGKRKPDARARLLSEADAAMYRAKHSGKDTIQMA